MTTYGIYSEEQESISGSNIYLNHENKEMLVSQLYKADNMIKAMKHFKKFKSIYTDSQFSGQIVKFIRKGKDDVPCPQLFCPI